MEDPSFWGLMPRSEVWMAFSMALRIEPSQGLMRRLLGSGEEMAATWLMGVGLP